MKNYKGEFWYPVLQDEKWLKRIRDDPEILEQYGEGAKYKTLWDHAGDAYVDFEPLADAFIEYEYKLKKIESYLSDFYENKLYYDPLSLLSKINQTLEE